VGFSCAYVAVAVDLEISGDDPEFGAVLGADDGGISHTFSADGGGQDGPVVIYGCPRARVVVVADGQMDRFVGDAILAGELEVW